MLQKDLNMRRDKILGLIIDSHVNTAEPIASRAISKKLRMSLSPATVRNVMSDLEEQELITHPHTSAGRIPTEKGYRYYISRLMRASLLTEEERKSIDREFKVKLNELNSLLDRTSNILSLISNQTGIVLFPILQKSFFKHVEFVRLDESDILIVLFTASGVTKNFVVNLNENISEPELSRISNFINKYMGKGSLDDIKREISRRLITERDSFFYVLEKAKAIIDIMLDIIKENKLYLNGRSYITEQPEFENIDKLKNLLRHLEDKDFMFSLLKKMIDKEGTNIYIGSELGGDFSECSLITCNYCIGDTSCGTLGVIGPIRMEYSRLISIVGYVAQKLSGVLG
jgi:heat-inducible transcriptional repressor